MFGYNVQYLMFGNGAILYLHLIKKKHREQIALITLLISLDIEGVDPRSALHLQFAQETCT